MRLLLAEDERELAGALVAILSHNHYSVDTVYDGQEALDYLLNGNYDGAILDVMMPKKSGLEVVRAARAEGLSLPILILTAKAEIDDRVLGLDSGADDYLTKPFASRELLARIRAMTRRAPEITDCILRFGNLSLNRTNFELSADKGTFRLANKEFQMLEMLMSDPGRLIPTELFMEKIWGYDSETEMNVVWVYISYLRKKLTVLDADVEIRATRGLGYSLEAKG
ncbi:MAG: response regulator transcription factor [Clostridia bacterium]|nr:response regulator transcription factor [Clostridia bacterium]